MRTTVNVPDHILVRAKQLAAIKRISLAALISEGIKMYLAKQHEVADHHLPVFPTHDLALPCSDLDLRDTSQLLELE